MPHWQTKTDFQTRNSSLTHWLSLARFGNRNDRLDLARESKRAQFSLPEEGCRRWERSQKCAFVGFSARNYFQPKEMQDDSGPRHHQSYRKPAPWERHQHCQPNVELFESRNDHSAAVRAKADQKNQQKHQNIRNWALLASSGLDHSSAALEHKK